MQSNTKTIQTPGSVVLPKQGDVEVRVGVNDRGTGIQETIEIITNGSEEPVGVPTRAFNVLNVREPVIDRQKSGFVYNKFRIDESLPLTDSYSLGDVELLGYAINDLKQRQLKNYPRYAHIHFNNPITAGLSFVHSQTPNQKDVQLMNKVRSAINSGTLRMDSIITEGGMTNFYASAFELFDTLCDLRLYSLLNLHRNLNEENNATYDSIDSYKKRAVSESNGAIGGKIIEDFLSDLSKQDVLLDIATKNIEDFKYQSIAVNLNSIFIDDIIKASSDDTCHLFEDEIRAISNISKELQDNAVSILTPDSFPDKDFNTYLRTGIIHDYYVINDQDIFLDDFKTYHYDHLGYVIEKIEYFGNEVNILDPIIIQDTNTANLIDTKVRYGARYTYRVRNLFGIVYTLYNSHENDATLDQFYRGVFVVASKSNEIEIDCREFERPRPPVDIRFLYIQRAGFLKINWNFPINPQRDIKGFQLFRRRNTSEPYTLLAEFDFNDSALRPVLRETAPERDFYRYEAANGSPRVIKSFLDEGFEEDTEYIYALASVDAHGHTSDLSSQIKVKYNSFSEKLERNVMSRPGAPKAYPNIFLRKDAFLNTIKSSGKNRMTVYFEPEYYDVTTKENGIEKKKGLISMVTKNEEDPESQEYSYLINFFNIDLQRSDLLKIVVKDDSFIPKKVYEPILDENNLSFSFIDESEPANFS